MFFASFSDSFKYFHTADTFAALVRKSIWLRHVVVRYNLFVFSLIRNFGCRTFGASLLVTRRSWITSALSTLNTTTQVKPLSKAPNPQLFPGCRSNMAAHCVCSRCVHYCVCAHLDGLNAELKFRVWVATRHFTFTLKNYQKVVIFYS